MDHFIKPADGISKLIEEKSRVLYQMLANLAIDEVNFPEKAKGYYQYCHEQRLFFSVQTAAELLYRSIVMKKKPVEELVVMDYGGGIGSLFLLAKMIGCKKVVYNDIMEDMVIGAQNISQHLNIPIDIFICGDHRQTIAELNSQGVECDIILSRNVIEHIYDLDDFYAQMAAGQKNALIYFSTTANHNNPGMLWFHKRLHQRYDKEYKVTREKMVKEKMPAISDAELDKAGTALRGLAMEDIEEAIEVYRQTGALPDPARFYTNTCDPENGVWAEHLLPAEDYKRIIESKGYKLTILPAFWDTHYTSGVKNLFGKMMNGITSLLGNKGGLRTTAFIYIIAEKK